MIYIKDELSSPEHAKALNAQSKALVASSIRLLMCWLSHESLLETEILDLMPHILAFTESASTDSDTQHLYTFLSAGLQKIYLNLMAKRDLKKSSAAKNEFEIYEIEQDMDKVKGMLDKCYVNMDQTQSDNQPN